MREPSAIFSKGTMNPPLSLIQFSDDQLKQMILDTESTQLQAALRDILKLRKKNLELREQIKGRR